MTSGQGEHDVTFRSGLVLSAYPVLFYVLYKVQLRVYPTTFCLGQCMILRLCLPPSYDGGRTCRGLLMVV